MDFSEPSAAISPGLEGPVLMVLAATHRPLSAREVSRLVKRGSWEGVRRALLRLAEQGVARVEEVGNVTQYTLNRSHLACPAVEVLSELRNELVRRLSETINGWEVPARHASLFGSAARGDGGPASDVDLLILRPVGVGEDDLAWRKQLDQLSEAVLGWTGNHAAVSEISPRELKDARSSTVVTEIRREGITLAGPPLSDLLERAR